MVAWGGGVTKKVEKQSDEKEIERMEDRAGVTAEEEIEEEAVE